MRQWSYDYSNRRHGHIVSPEDGQFLVTVFPAYPYTGSLELRHSDTLVGAVKEADVIAQEQSQPGDWISGG